MNLDFCSTPNLMENEEKLKFEEKPFRKKLLGLKVIFNYNFYYPQSVPQTQSLLVILENTYD